MSFPGDPSHTPGAAPKPAEIAAVTDPRVHLRNLSTVGKRVDALQKFLSNLVNSNTPLVRDEMDRVSAELTDAIQKIIANGVSLVASNQTGGTGEGSEIIEMDAAALMAEHIHFCEICGKGFKRDANVRMHMRAHGNQYKTAEALAKRPAENCRPQSHPSLFSCPFPGCSRNKSHRKFRGLKSAICAKNHFKRSHCPKAYPCNRCNKKSFSVAADLKSHLKHCGATKWKCSCGTSFSRKDKLLGHIALFQGHMPAAAVEEAEKEEELIFHNSSMDDADFSSSSIQTFWFQNTLGGSSPSALDFRHNNCWDGHFFI
ncbi:unnamed protein product [Cuscuta europaea]|uniref:C2H2-type domain-containing protein n=1 Tax=Cuscuta europaea TaxID=41803 RepID=A0A9P0Z820_CUSEU|nr:unnamed protein product [Cuscuta europaea]